MARTMPDLVDANVWLALLVREHVHHAATRVWYEGVGIGQAGICRITELSVTRLLGNRTVMGKAAIPAAESWRQVMRLQDDGRVQFIAEPADVGETLPTLLRYKVPTKNLVMDAYLAAFAICAGRRLVTFDRGFQQFQGLHYVLLPA